LRQHQVPLQARFVPIWNLVMGVNATKGKEVQHYLTQSWNDKRMKDLEEGCLPPYKSRMFTKVNECPPSYRHIQSYDECLEAVQYSRDSTVSNFPKELIMGERDQEISNAGYKPKGCYMVTKQGHHFNHVFFNKDPPGGGKGASNHVLVCALKKRSTCQSAQSDIHWANPRVDDPSIMNLKGTNQCLDIETGYLKAQDCGRNFASQVWFHQSNGVIKNKESGKCLDISDAKCHGGNSVITYECNGQDNQGFLVEGSEIRPHSCPTMCLDVAADHNNHIKIWPCSKAPQQQIDLLFDGDAPGTAPAPPPVTRRRRRRRNRFWR